MATMISHRKKFIFIHIYKTAGTSVTSVLAPYDDNPLLNHPFVRTVRNRIGLASYNIMGFTSFEHHATALMVKNRIEKSTYDEFFKFAFVRNPWDMQVSLYHYMLKNKAHPQHSLIKKMSFDEYIEWRVECDVHLQKEFVVDETGNIIIDFIGRFENLSDDVRTICKNIDIEYTLPDLNKSNHRDYKVYYNAKTRKLIHDAYIDDIDIFGYVF